MPWPSPRGRPERLSEQHGWHPPGNASVPCRHRAVRNQFASELFREWRAGRGRHTDWRQFRDSHDTRRACQWAERHAPPIVWTRARSPRRGEITALASGCLLTSSPCTTPFVAYASYAPTGFGANAYIVTGGVNGPSAIITISTGLSSQPVTAMVAGDFNCDGKTDLAFASANGGQVIVFGRSRPAADASREAVERWLLDGLDVSVGHRRCSRDPSSKNDAGRTPAS